MATHAEIVVTSTWRLSHELSSLTAMLRAKGLVTADVLDATPFIPYHRGRGQDIQQWLDRAPSERGWSIEGMVIVDDLDDMLHLPPWLVQTTFETGLTDTHISAAMQVLARSMPPPFEGDAARR